MQDDLNTPEALAALSGLASEAEDRLISIPEVERFKRVLHGIDELLGLGLTKRGDITDKQKALIIDREHARGAKDWAKSDQLRDLLAAEGIGVRDTAHGPIWYRQ